MHEAAGILRTENRCAGAAHQKAAVEMHGNHLAPIRPAHAMKNAIAQDAGIVHQYVDAAEGIECGGDDLVGIARLADRQRRSDGFAAGLDYFFDDGMRRSSVRAGTVEARTDVADDNACAFLRHEECNALADAPPGAGDDGNFAGDNVGHSVPSAPLREVFTPTL